MNNKYCFEALDKSLQDLRDNYDQPFGGMTVILGGDFRQILPVITAGTKEHIIDATITNSYLWPYFEILTLTKNMRLKHNNISTEENFEITEFSNWILEIGNGISAGIKDTENEDATWIKIPEKFLLHYDSNPIKKITLSIYDDFIHNFNNIEYLRERAIVSSKIKQLMKLINIFYYWFQQSQ